MQAQPKIGFFEKYAIYYYAFIPFYLLAVLSFELTGKLSLLVLILYLTHYIKMIMPKDSTNLNPKIANYHNQHIYHMIPLIASVFGAWALLAYTWINYQQLSRTNSDLIMTFVGVGTLLASSVNASHQLFHKGYNFCKRLGTLHMVIFHFVVYETDHLYNHHRHVGTRKDIITCPKGKNFYQYLVHVFVGAYRFAYNYNKKTFFSLMALYFTYIMAIFFLAYKELGTIQLALQKSLFIYLIGLTTYIVFQTVEYIQHYGLVFGDNEEQEKVRQRSSWNADQDMLINIYGFRYQRHSDHHMNAFKYYSTLSLTPSMPTFKFSFFEGMLLCLIPPFWFYIANPYVDEQMSNKKVQQSHHLKAKIVIQAVFLAATLNALISCL